MPDVEASAKKLGKDVQAGTKRLGEDVQAGTKRLGDEILASTRACRARIRVALLTTPILTVILGHTLAKQVRPAIEHLAEVASKPPSAV